MAIAPELAAGPDASAGSAPNRSLRLRQTVVVLLMFGGYGASGLGREKGVAGFCEFLQAKAISTPAVA